MAHLCPFCGEKFDIDRYLKTGKCSVCGEKFALEVRPGGDSKKKSDKIKEENASARKAAKSKYSRISGSAPVPKKPITLPDEGAGGNKQKWERKTSAENSMGDPPGKKKTTRSNPFRKTAGNAPEAEPAVPESKTEKKQSSLLRKIGSEADGKPAVQEKDEKTMPSGMETKTGSGTENAPSYAMENIPAARPEIEPEPEPFPDEEQFPEPDFPEDEDMLPEFPDDFPEGEDDGWDDEDLFEDPGGLPEENEDFPDWDETEEELTVGGFTEKTNDHTQDRDEEPWTNSFSVGQDEHESAEKDLPADENASSGEADENGSSGFFQEPGADDDEEPDSGAIPAPPEDEYRDSPHAGQLTEIEGGNESSFYEENDDEEGGEYEEEYDEEYGDDEWEQEETVISRILSLIPFGKERTDEDGDDHEDGYQDDMEEEGKEAEEQSIASRFLSRLPHKKEKTSGELLEYADSGFNSNSDGYYDDVMPASPEKEDRFILEIALKIAGAVAAMAAVANFLIWYF